MYQATTFSVRKGMYCFPAYIRYSHHAIDPLHRVMIESRGERQRLNLDGREYE